MGWVPRARTQGFHQSPCKRIKLSINQKHYCMDGISKTERAGCTKLSMMMISSRPLFAGWAVHFHSASKEWEIFLPFYLFGSLRVPRPLQRAGRATVGEPQASACANDCRCCNTLCTHAMDCQHAPSRMLYCQLRIPRATLGSRISLCTRWRVAAVFFFLFPFWINPKPVVIGSLVKYYYVTMYVVSSRNNE